MIGEREIDPTHCDTDEEDSSLSVRFRFSPQTRAALEHARDEMAIVERFPVLATKQPPHLVYVQLCVLLPLNGTQV